MYGRTNGDTFIGLPNRRIYDTSHGSSAVPIFGTTSPTGEIVYDGSMTVSGFKIGTVSYTGDIAVGGLLPDSWVRLSGWKPWVRSVPDHFWRTLVADRGPEGIPTPPWYHLACLYWLDFLHKSREDYPSQSYNGLPSTAVNFILRMESVIWNRRLIVVKDISQQKSSGSAQANAQEEKQELFGLAPAVTQDNDCIVVLDGCSVPVVLRQRDDRWILVGECFVYGIMEGESMQMEEYLGRTQEFLLV